MDPRPKVFFFCTLLTGGAPGGKSTGVVASATTGVVTLATTGVAALATTGAAASATTGVVVPATTGVAAKTAAPRVALATTGATARAATGAPPAACLAGRGVGATFGAARGEVAGTTTAGVLAAILGSFTPLGFVGGRFLGGGVLSGLESGLRDLLVELGPAASICPDWSIGTTVGSGVVDVVGSGVVDVVGTGFGSTVDLCVFFVTFIWFRFGIRRERIFAYDMPCFSPMSITLFLASGKLILSFV